MTNDPIGPEEIRALRGALTREAFAVLVGVTPLTVYRWELPLDAPQSRRPRASTRERIRRAVAQRDSAEEHVPGDDRLAAVIDAIGQASFDRAEDALLPLLTDEAALQTPERRAQAQIAHATVELLGRQRARSALGALVPVLAQVDALSPLTAARAHAIAALLFSWPDGRLFDAGRATHHAERGLKLAGTPDLEVISRVGRLQAALRLGDLARFEQLYARDMASLGGGTQPLARFLAEEMHIVAAWVTGKTNTLNERLAQLAETAGASGFALLECRALAHEAFVHKLGSDPQAALDLVRAADELTVAARLEPGHHQVLLGVSEARALCRLGRYDELAETAQRTIAAGVAADWPPLSLAWARTNWLFAADPIAARAEIDHLDDALSRWDRSPFGRSVAVARTFLQTFSQLLAVESREATQLADQLIEAVHESAPSLWLLWDAYLIAILTHTMAGDPKRARKILRQAEALLEQRPSAHGRVGLELAASLLCSAEGRRSEALRHQAAATAALQSSGDPAAPATSALIAAIAARLDGDADADAAWAQAEADLAALGLGVPALLARERVEALVARGVHPPATETRPLRLNDLIAPIERLASCTVDSRAIGETLLATARELTGLESITLARDDDDMAEVLDVSNDIQLELPADLTPDQESALHVLATVAGLTLKLAGWQAAASSSPPATLTGKVDIPGLIASSQEIRALARDLVRLKNSVSTILIQGESGTGKELIARGVHHHSRRAEGPFVAVNCTAIPTDLFEAQLFGHRKGAFTGAVSDNPGLIRSAARGTLFLDEIGDLPLAVQAKLLRFLDYGEIQPLGEAQPLRVDVRVVSATHSNLDAKVAAGEFREDLLYRLRVIPIRVPPLRQRPADVVALARHFVTQFSPPDEPVILAPEALQLLLAHSWPGNVRELQNVIERALAYDPPPRILTPERLHLGA